MTEREMQRFLEAKIAAGGIAACVAREALYVDVALLYKYDAGAGTARRDIRLWFSEFIAQGCISGAVSGLIYYADTANFFDAHYDEIEELRKRDEYNHGPLLITEDLKTFFAWFAFEKVAADMAIEIGVAKDTLNKIRSGLPCQDEMI